MSPSGSDIRQTPPSVRVPSTSMRKRRILRARSVTVSEAFSCIARFYLRLTASKIISNFDQVAIGIANIDGANPAHGSVAFDRACLKVDTKFGDVADDLVERSAGDETEVGRAWHGMGSVGLDLVTALVKLDRLRAEGQCFTPVQSDRVHAQNFRVEVDGGVNIGYGEYQVVKLIEGKGHVSG